jgi:hypothetical protein
MRDEKPYPPEETEQWEVKLRKPRRRKTVIPGGLYDVAGAAVRLDITEEKVRTFVRNGDLKFINVGHGSKRPRYRFTDSDINELIEKRRQTLSADAIRHKIAMATDARQGWRDGFSLS